MIGEMVLKDDTGNRANRGFSGFRSDADANLSGFDYTKYKVKVGKNGLRKADAQQFWFQSSIGPNILYYAGSALNTNHDSSKTIIEVLTHNTIQGQIVSNCAFYSAKLNLFSNNIGVSDIPTLNGVVTPHGYTIKTGVTYSYDFINSCAVNSITAGNEQLTRFRMRFKDFTFTDNASSQAYELRTVQMSLTDATELLVVNTRSAPGTPMENLFIWKNVNVKNFSSFYAKDQDAVILDAYMRVWFNSGISTTDGVISEYADIKTLDNMYVLSDNDNNLPTGSIAFRFQGIWFEDGDKNLGNGDYSQTVVNPGELWPTVLHIYGNLSSGIPTNTAEIILFFDFLAPLTADGVETMGVYLNGATATSVTFHAGVMDV